MGAPRKFVRCEGCGRPDGWPVSRKCMRCIHKDGDANRKYPHWTPERDAIVREAYAAGTSKPALSAALTRATARLAIPRYMVRARAGVLGLTLDTRRPWTPAEREIVERYAGSRSLNWIIGCLKRKGSQRSLASLRSFMGAWGLRWKFEHGYSMGDLVRILGVSFLSVQKWRDQGLLVIKDGRVTEGSMRTLIYQHPELYSLRRVDEVWFKGFLFPAAPCFVLEPGEELRKRAAQKRCTAIAAARQEVA